MLMVLLYRSYKIPFDLTTNSLSLSHFSASLAAKTPNLPRSLLTFLPSVWIVTRRLLPSCKLSFASQYKYLSTKIYLSSSIPPRTRISRTYHTLSLLLFFFLSFLLNKVIHLTSTPTTLLGACQVPPPLTAASTPAQKKEAHLLLKKTQLRNPDLPSLPTGRHLLSLPTPTPIAPRSLSPLSPPLSRTVTTSIVARPSLTSILRTPLHVSAYLRQFIVPPLVLPHTNFLP